MEANMSLGLRIFLMFLLAAGTAAPADPTLETNCLACHREQKLPDNLIYRRYLLKYSSAERIEQALIDYLKHPTQPTSIMPAEFFLRFPMKPPTKQDDPSLRKNIRQYMDYFDVRKRLRLEKQNQ